MVHEQEDGGRDAYVVVPAAEAAEKLLSGEWQPLPEGKENLRQRVIRLVRENPPFITTSPATRQG